jgi:molecular chaperone DnaK (HSP70)
MTASSHILSNSSFIFILSFDSIYAAVLRVLLNKTLNTVNKQITQWLMTVAAKFNDKQTVEYCAWKK